jgi:hypothetical protein
MRSADWSRAPVATAAQPRPSPAAASRRRAIIASPSAPQKNNGFGRGGVSNTDRDYHKYINVLVDVTICAMPPELPYPAKQETTKRLPVARLRPEGADLLGLQHGDCFASCEGL